MRGLTIANMATLAVSWHLRAVPLIEELPAEHVGGLPVSLPLAARETTLNILLDNGAFQSPPPSADAIPELALDVSRVNYFVRFGDNYLGRLRVLIKLVAVVVSLRSSPAPMGAGELRGKSRGHLCPPPVLLSLAVIPA